MNIFFRRQFWGAKTNGLRYHTGKGKPPPVGSGTGDVFESSFCRVGKNPGFFCKKPGFFLKKTQPSVFLKVFLGFLGFSGFFWFFMHRRESF